MNLYVLNQETLLRKKFLEVKRKYDSQKNRQKYFFCMLYQASENRSEEIQHIDTDNGCTTYPRINLTRNLQRSYNSDKFFRLNIFTYREIYYVLFIFQKENLLS